MTVHIPWTDTEHRTNTKQTTIKEKLSKNLEQLDSYNEGVFIFYWNLSKSQKVLLDKSNGRIREKALKYKAFGHKKDLASKP